MFHRHGGDSVRLRHDLGVDAWFDRELGVKPRSLTALGPGRPFEFEVVKEGDLPVNVDVPVEEDPELVEMWAKEPGVGDVAEVVAEPMAPPNNATKVPAASTVPAAGSSAVQPRPPARGPTPHDIEPILDTAQGEINKAQRRKKRAENEKKDAVAEVAAIERQMKEPDLVHEMFGEGPAPIVDYQGALDAAKAKVATATGEVRAAERVIRVARKRIAEAKEASIVDPLFEGDDA